MLQWRKGLGLFRKRGEGREWGQRRGDDGGAGEGEKGERGRAVRGMRWG